MVGLLRQMLALFVFGLVAVPVYADVTVDQLLLRDEAPDGVVFEIIADDDGLDWAVPAIRTHVQRLRERWPDLEIAVVSHGREQFALTRNEAVAYPDVHASYSATAILMTRLRRVSTSVARIALLGL